MKRGRRSEMRFKRARMLDKMHGTNLHTYTLLLLERKTMLRGAIGNCAICRYGQIENHKCDLCETEFCSVCNGTLKELPKHLPQNVGKCICHDKWLR